MCLVGQVVEFFWGFQVYVDFLFICCGGLCICLGLQVQVVGYQCYCVQVVVLVFGWMFFGEVVVVEQLYGVGVDFYCFFGVQQLCQVSFVLEWLVVFGQGVGVLDYQVYGVQFDGDVGDYEGDFLVMVDWFVEGFVFVVVGDYVVQCCFFGVQCQGILGQGCVIEEGLVVEMFGGQVVVCWYFDVFQV